MNLETIAFTIDISKTIAIFWNVIIMWNFLRFLEIVKAETQKGGLRPVYICDFLKKVDDATNISAFCKAKATR